MVLNLFPLSLLFLHLLSFTTKNERCLLIKYLFSLLKLSVCRSNKLTSVNLILFLPSMCKHVQYAGGCVCCISKIFLHFDCQYTIFDTWTHYSSFILAFVMCDIRYFFHSIFVIVHLNLSEHIRHEN